MRLRTQIGIGLGVAIVLVGVLQWCVGETDPEATDPKPGVRPPSRESMAPDLAAEGREILGSLQGVAEQFHIAPNRDLLPAGCAPVLKILPGGTIQVPVAPPIVSAPGPIRWQRIGVLVPQARMADLSPSERSSLTQIWSRLAGGARLARERIHLHGLDIETEELELLLRWMR